MNVIRCSRQCCLLHVATRSSETKQVCGRSAGNLALSHLDATLKLVSYSVAGL